MFQDGVITCLSCGKTTPAESVSSLPENPYLRPEVESARGRTISGNGEEVYYSDSDDDSPPSAGLQNGSNGAHVQGVRDMVINTQKANIHKINSMLESNMNKVLSAKVIRGQKDKTLREAIKAAEQFKNKLEEEFKNCETHCRGEG